MTEDEIYRKIEHLQAHYDKLVLKRAGIVKVYDALWDGDPQKVLVLNRLDRTGDAIRAIEKRMADLTDKLPNPEHLFGS